MARAQARDVAARIAEQGGPTGLEDKELVAIIAYLQRLGIDIHGAGPMARAAEPAKGGE
jgi:cytochrome c oxidase cbb3-type subunit I/II